MNLTADGRLLFATRTARLFAYGFLSVVLVLYLVESGLSETTIGILLSLTLLGDTALSLWMTTSADRMGRRRMLIAGAILMVGAGIGFALTHQIVLLLLAATIGVISPSGNEVGPFLAIEQAALSQIVPAHDRTRVFAWYNLSGSFATALGALFGGALTQSLQSHHITPLDSYRVVLFSYAATGVALALLFARLSSATEVVARGDDRGIEKSSTKEDPKSLFGLHRSRGIVLRLSGLFCLDAFAGGFILQSLIAYWFHLRFGVEPGVLGAIFFGGNLLAGISALVAARVAERFGLINTMVFTHIPSNILLILVPLMPNLPLAITLLMVRFSISQMDVPTRQSYVMAVVTPEERSAAAGVTGIARTIGAAMAPCFVGMMLSHSAWFNAPFFVAGGLKIVYDLLLYRSFRAHQSPKETASL